MIRSALAVGLLAMSLVTGVRAQAIAQVRMPEVQAHARARDPEPDACERLRGATPTEPRAVLIDRGGKVLRGPIDVGRVAPDADPRPPARHLWPTGYRIVVAPLSAEPDSVAPSEPAVLVRAATRAVACPDARTYDVVLAWEEPAGEQGPLAGAFSRDLPDFTFEARDEHDHGSRDLYRFDARVIGRWAR